MGYMEYRWGLFGLEEERLCIKENSSNGNVSRPFRCYRSDSEINRWLGHWVMVKYDEKYWKGSSHPYTSGNLRQSDFLWPFYWAYCSKQGSHAHKPDLGSTYLGPGLSPWRLKGPSLGPDDLRLEPCLIRNIGGLYSFVPACKRPESEYALASWRPVPAKQHSLLHF